MFARLARSLGSWASPWHRSDACVFVLIGEGHRGTYLIVWRKKQARNRKHRKYTSERWPDSDVTIFYE
eukprot:2291985-Pyramimonas_sp.AAC.1